MAGLGSGKCGKDAQVKAAILIGAVALAIGATAWHNNNMSISDIIGSKSVGLQCQYAEVTEYYTKDALPTSPTTKQHTMVIELNGRTWRIVTVDENFREAMVSALKSLLISEGASFGLRKRSLFFLLRRATFHAGLALRARARFSTGCRRRACGQASEVQRGVQIARSLETAVVAAEPLLRPSQRRLDDAAARTGLARRKPPAGDNEARAIEPRLVGQLPPELEEATIHNASRDVAIFGHALHVQVFNADGFERLGESGCEFVCRVAADVGNASMDASQTGLLLAPVA